MATNEAIEALSEKEKQTLRLIVRGHDAKSTARTLGLSVHTINERLREARRKMSVHHAPHPRQNGTPPVVEIGQLAQHHQQARGPVVGAEQLPA